MFGIIESLAQAAVSVAKLPIDVAADVVTMGGVMTDKDKPYTAEGLEDLMRNLKAAVK
jgi:hypothetical protein